MLRMGHSSFLVAHQLIPAFSHVQETRGETGNTPPGYALTYPIYSIAPSGPDARIPFQGGIFRTSHCFVDQILGEGLYQHYSRQGGTERELYVSAVPLHPKIQVQSDL